MKRWADLASITLGLVTAAVLFPTHGVAGCASGSDGGDCESYSVSVLVRYEGDNGAVGMATSVAVGIAVGGLTYLFLGWLTTRNATSAARHKRRINGRTL